MPQPAAIFCLERVLATQPLEPVFIRHLAAVGLRESPTAQLAGLSSRLLAAGIGENALSARASEAALAPSAGWTQSEVQRASEAAADELVAQVPPHGLVELEDHKEAGCLAVLVTAFPEPLVAAFAERLGFDAVLATRWETSGGTFTGRLAGPLMWGRERLRAVNGWAAENDVALDESFVYAGSLADAPLLGAVGHPRAVNADARLAALAAVRRWPIRWFDLPPGAIKVGGRELQEWLRPFADERLITNAQIEITGLENIPRTGAAILVFNHRSYFDAPVVSLVIQKAGRSVRGIGKKEVFDAPVIGAFAHAMGGIRVERGTGSDEPLSRAIKALRGGEMIMISPEGTIPRGPAFFEPELRGRWGTARMAHATRAPVIPMGIWGAEKVWPRNQRLPTMVFSEGPPRVTVTIGKPVKLKYDDVDADTKRIMSGIVDLLPAEARIRRTPTEEELRRTYPPNYKGDPSRELTRRPGLDR